MFTQPCLPLSHSVQSYGPYTEVAVCSRRQKEDKKLNCLGNKSVERYIRHYADTPVCQVLKPAAKIESTESLGPSRERSEEQATWGFRISSAYGAPNSRNWFRSVPVGTSFVVASIRLQSEHSAASRDEEYLRCFFKRSGREPCRGAAWWPERLKNGKF